MKHNQAHQFVDVEAISKALGEEIDSAHLGIYIVFMDDMEFDHAAQR